LDQGISKFLLKVIKTYVLHRSSACSRSRGDTQHSKGRNLC